MLSSPFNETEGQLKPLENLIDLLVELQQDQVVEAVSRLYQTHQSKSEAADPSEDSLPIVSLALEGSKISRDVGAQSLAQRVQNIEQQLYAPTDIINPLLPLITELLQLKTDETKESLLRALSSLIDEAIHQRTREDQTKMGAAIAGILPAAIAHQVKNSPEDLARAIAPEISAAIQEQIRLDPVVFASVIGPQMGNAIKNQIEVERDSMVDALYPVIGNTIAKYMGEVVQSINHKIETAFSTEGLIRKIRARVKGVTEAEIILQESLPFTVQAVFLIHKDSGLIIRERQLTLNAPLDASMLAGMLTAIRSFVRECVMQGDNSSELHRISYDASNILIEVAGYCYLAIILTGSPPQSFTRKIRDALSKIVVKYGKSVAAYDGDITSVPESIDPILDALLLAPVTQKSKSPPSLLIILGLFLLLLGIFLYRGHIAARAEQNIAAHFDLTPELALYRIRPQIQHGTLTLSGQVPQPSLVQNAEQVARAAAPDWPIRNQVVAVNVPPAPETVEQSMQQILQFYNSKKGVAVASSYSGDQQKIQVEGFIANVKDAKNLTQSLESIAGVRQVASLIRIAPVLDTRLYFFTNSAQVQLLDTSTKLKEVQQFLALNPEVTLKIIGHGAPAEAAALRQLRAQRVKQSLVARGVNAPRLIVGETQERPSEIPKGSPAWLSRCVRFELFVPDKR